MVMGRLLCSPLDDGVSKGCNEAGSAESRIAVQWYRRFAVGLW